jgi:hypothetical protein
LWGRFKHGLTPWRNRGIAANEVFRFVFGNHIFNYWSAKWKSAEDWLTAIEDNLIASKTRVKRGGDFDDWDILVRNGLFISGRGLLAIEEHGAGQQQLRFRCNTSCSLLGYVLTGSLGMLSLIAASEGEILVASVLWCVMCVTIYRYLIETAGCMNDLYTAFSALNHDSSNGRAKEDWIQPIVQEIQEKYEEEYKEPVESNEGMEHVDFDSQNKHRA